MREQYQGLVGHFCDWKEHCWCLKAHWVFEMVLLMMEMELLVFEMVILVIEMALLVTCICVRAHI